MELDHQEEPTGDVETLKSTEEDEQILFNTHYNKSESIKFTRFKFKRL